MRKIMPSKYVAFAAISLCLVLVSAPAGAARTDVVYLKNGDRITCSVKELDRGKLRVITDHMGTIHIDWVEVQSITATKTYEVQIDSGERYWGELAPGRDGNSLSVEKPDENTDIDLDRIVHVTEIKRTFLDRLDGSIDFGLNAQKTNSDVNYSINASVTHRDKQHEASLDYRSILSDRNDSPRAFRNVLDFTYSHFLNQRWDIVGLGKLEQNDELGLDLRTNLGAAMSRYFLRNNRTHFSVAAGLTTNRERFVLDPETQTSLEALFMTTFDFFIHGDLGADLSATLNVLPSLTESGRYRIEVAAIYRHEIVTDFFISFSGWYSYDNQAPVQVNETLSQDDYGFVTSLGWMF